ncbi:MAG: YncE family protein [Ignavibacteriaceae bacterium]
MKKLFLSLCLLFMFHPAILFSQTSGYKVSGLIKLGGKGWWDYTAVDVPVHRLYVSHNTKVNVIDLKTNTVVGEISNLKGAHGIAFADEFGKGFISNGKNSSVTVFDLKTLKTIDILHVTGKGPDAIVYEPFTHRVFSFNEISDNVTAIDAETDKVIGTIILDGRPEFPVSNNKGLMFVNLGNKNQIEEFSAITLKKIAEYPLSPGKEPTGLAMDVSHGILFSGCNNKLMTILNAATGKIITTLPIGGSVDACAFDPVTKLAFSSNGEGTLTVIKEISPIVFKIVDNIATSKGLRTMALDPTNHNVYLIGMLGGKNHSKSFGVLVLEKD